MHSQNAWRNTQVRLKGSVLKTDRSRNRRRGSNPFSSAKFFRYRGMVAVWQLVGLITRRSQVQILLPQPMVRQCSGLSRLPVTQEITGSNPVRTAMMASQLSRQSRGLKILVSLVQFPLEPPERQIQAKNGFF